MKELNEWLKDTFGKGDKSKPPTRPPQHQPKPAHPKPGMPPAPVKRFRPEDRRDMRPPSPSPNRGKLRVVPLGGMEEVGKNMMVFEFGNDIVIIDMGLQFPEEGMPGIDYVIPDISYLKGKERNIRGVIITHGHYDHIGAIPYLMPKLGLSIPIYSLQLTISMIRKRQEEYGDQLNLKVISPDDVLRLGQFRAEFFRVNHTIPDSMGIALHSPVGTIVHTGDWKMDHSPVNDQPIELNKIARFGHQGVLAAFCDSTSAGKPGYQLSESEIQDTLDRIFSSAKGRIITGTFASLLTRMQQIITLSERFGRKVVIEGRSMKNNVEIAKQLNYLRFQPRTIITIKEANKLPDNKVTIMCTGAQGERNAALMRIATKQHPEVSIHKGDTIVFSSSVIPGNENTVQLLTDKLYRAGASVINYQMMDIHAGGHAKAEEAKMLIRLLKPRFFVPIQANHFLLVLHGEVAEQVGITRDRILIPDNGSVIEFDAKSAKILPQKVPHNMVAVDGLGVGDVEESVLNDRQHMAANGIVTVLFTVDKQSGQLKTNPDITSRGLIFIRGAEKLMNEARDEARRSFLNHSKKTPIDIAEVKNLVRRDLEKFIFKKIEREPLILPMIVQV